MKKDNKQLLEEIKTLKKRNGDLLQQLLVATKGTHAIKNGNIDGLVIAHKKSLKIYTEQTADKSYRILVEKMHEGAVTLNKEGVILYSNSWFSKLVGLPLQRVIGSKFRRFIDDSSRDEYITLFKKGWQGYSQNEVNLFKSEHTPIPVLMSVNTLSLENGLVLSIIVTDLTPQKKRAEFKSSLVEKIITVIDEMNHPDEFVKVNNSDYISKKLNYDYTYMSNIFSEVKGISIQQFIINHKIEKVKDLLLNTDSSLTDISYKLHYSSVAHLSNQFKKITGKSPTFYKETKRPQIK